MKRKIKPTLPINTSKDGKRCYVVCPHAYGGAHTCNLYGVRLKLENGRPLRDPQCISDEVKDESPEA
jgi:hypothetical protein